MDPLSAIGLVSGVLSFVGFASNLISTSTNVYRSVDGAAEQTFELQRVYRDLSSFSLKLKESQVHDEDRLSLTETPAALIPDADVTIAVHMRAVRELAGDCRTLCDQLLATLEKLKLEDGRWRVFQSFKAGLRTVLDGKKIAEMESRIDRCKSTMSIHFFPILR
jgi:hypothetical protein